MRDILMVREALNKYDSTYPLPSSTHQGISFKSFLKHYKIQKDIFQSSYSELHLKYM